MNENSETIGKITSMLCKITDGNLLKRIYRFVMYIYIYREGRASA